MEPDLRKGHDVRGLTPLRGTWIAIAIMSPVLVAQIAFAVPRYLAQDTPEAAVTTTYDAQDDADPLNTPTTEGSNAPRDATEVPDGTTDLPGNSAEVPDSTTDFPGNSAEVPDGPINHGQVMKQLQELTDGPASGCLTSAVARSDLGKGNQRDQTDTTNTTLSPTFADEFECTSVKAPDGNGTSEVSKDTATNRPGKQNPSDTSRKDSAKSKNGRGKSGK
ncbi:MAG: hypothetical protein BMS9Abin17_1118 [Acidimicrobiia bacterium]|nr:MAG: hypothetical protein BMS9Abin17_1118 [Acidimicrobiia bacterium]